MWKLTKEHKVKINGIRYLLDDLGMFFKTKPPHHLITGSAKLKRLERCLTLFSTSRS